MIRRRPPLLRRLRNAALVLVASAAVVAANGPVVVDAVDYARYEYQRHQADYQEQYGYWETVELPEQFRLSAIHAALLHTGKVLLIAGSGNNAERFEAGTFRSILWDPATGNIKEIPTPEDFFCAGHAYLPDGDLLIAGGTARVRAARGPGRPRRRRPLPHERPRRGPRPAGGHPSSSPVG